MHNLGGVCIELACKDVAVRELLRMVVLWRLPHDLSARSLLGVAVIEF